MPRNSVIAAAAFIALIAGPLAAQVTFERILRADEEPGNWLTYNRTYSSQHHSPLDQINRENVADLELKWVFQARSLHKFEMTPLVVDDVVYVVQMPNDVVALDAVTGRKFWQYTHAMDGTVNVCCGRINRGLAILGDTLYMGTIDGKLVALDAKTGAVVFSRQIVDPTGGYSLTHAPLVLKDKLIVGSAGGEYGIRGFIVALDPRNGDEIWRFHTIPGPGEPGHETWSGDSWERGGGSIWLTGSYDPELNLTYWGVGNPAPDWNGDVRLGDNLYTDSVVALDADTGKLRWHFQFTPHDEWDWDAVQIPVLVDREWEGEQRKLMLWANRNGFYYVLDRTTGEFLHGKNFVEVTWAKGLDENGRPIKIPEASPTREGVRVSPAVQGGTNWYSPAYSEKTGLFYVSAWEYSSVYHKGDPTYTRGNRYPGSVPHGVWPNTMKDSEEQQGYGAIRALSPTTGDLEWEFRMTGIGESGILSTAGDMLVTGSREGFMLVLDSFTGKNILTINLGGIVAASPITFTAGGKQRIAVSSGNAMFVFGLRE
ncbi:MAG: PQQ-dependent dehydrogenase, methanol/ethanol family [Bryobacterales bacterium]|nr:PQQ-dependent dehydrogenase, methanol/ethanol family [Bryobacterales bacterium]